ncbi:hypothetical protein JTB14_033008 [Gonioctena quinquepunctata]|nr:hypothetical protein JTB14_033008 [Gonioctena quinquepunctata]
MPFSGSWLDGEDVSISNILKQLQDAAPEEQITFYINPASAAHMGGLSEAEIKLVKFHSSRFGEQLPTYEELNSVVVQIKLFLNSRPSMPMNSDPNDRLAPRHISTMEHLAAIIETDDEPLTPSHVFLRWTLLQRMFRSFWDGWCRKFSIFCVSAISRPILMDNDPLWRVY